MSSFFVARRGALTALTVFAAAALFFLGLTQGSAQALSPQPPKVTGNAAFTVGAGKAGKVLKKGNVKVKRVAPAKIGRKGKNFVAKLPVRNLLKANRTDVPLNGGFVFRKGKRGVKVRALNVVVKKNGTTVIGGVIQRLGGKNTGLLATTIFRVNGKAKIATQGKRTTLQIKKGKVAFLPGVAKSVRKHLGLKKVPNGQIAALNLNAVRTDFDTPVDPCVANPNAEGCQPVDPCVENPDAEGCQPQPAEDPYLAQCGVALTAVGEGSLPPASALPEFTPQAGASGPSSVTWGFKASFRGYLLAPNTAGSMHALDGASRTSSAPSAGFDFPVKDSSYSDHGTPNDPSDDKAIVETSGTALFCATGHNFRVAMNNLTFVIDGANSRVIADVDANLSGTWFEAQRVDLAKFDIAGAQAEALATGGAASVFNFDELPGTLTAAGGAAICGAGADPACHYVEGTEVDPVSLDFTGPVLCNVDVASTNGNAWPTAAALPTLTDPQEIVAPTSIDWGFKSTFRNYVAFSPPAGSMEALNGASRSNPSPTAGFNFPISGGEYSDEDPIDITDDKAVINGTGTAFFCKSGHFFWIAISNPTIVIDGDDSRIVADLTSNESNEWKTTKRVHLADLDLSGITPFYNKSGTEVTWGQIPVTLNEDAAPFAGTYPAGDGLDPIDVSISTGYDTGEGDAAAWDALATKLAADHPFPLSDNSQGGCTLFPNYLGNSPTGGTGPLARTIDEFLSFGQTTYQWFGNGANPAAEPDLSGAESVDGGGLDWGFHSTLRGSLNGSGMYNLGGGVTASHTPYFGNGPGSQPRAVANVQGQMTNALDRFFSWPAATSAGYLDKGGAGNGDDRLVLRNEGSMSFCQSANNQWYGLVVANPTVIIDGDDSRIVADVSARYRLSWVRGLIDLAHIDLSNATYPHEEDEGVATWKVVVPKTAGDPVANQVTVTPAGNAVLGMLSGSYFAEGAALDGLTVSAVVPEEE